MREAYRQHKQQYLYELLNSADKKIVLSLGYVGKEIVPFDFAEKRMKKFLVQLSAEIAK